jgi:signal transduction histidine kinase
MEITDNGIGFTTEGEASKGIGIISMKERAASIGGKIRINSTKDTGTSIILEIKK